MGLLFSLIKNINAKRMNRDLIGYSLEETVGPITSKDVKAYAEATRDTNSEYGNENAIVPPIFGSKLIYPQLKKIMTHGKLKLNLLKMVHGQQEMIWHKPMKVGDTLQIKAFIKDIYDIPIGEMIEITGQGYKDGELLAEATIGFLVKGKRNENAKKFEEVKRHDEAFKLTIETKEGQQLQYAKASGDNNFIHTSTILAKIAGLPRTIMQGICVLAMCNDALMKKTVAGDLQKLGKIFCRFARPVLPGDTLTLVAFKTDNKNVLAFDVYNHKDQQVIKNGLFTHK